MHLKNNPSNYSYKARYRYCSKCGGDRIHKWFTVRKLSVIDELALQPIPYGKEIKDIKFIIPEDLDIDDEHKQAIYDKQELFMCWTFEINVCDDCKEAELWEDGIFIKRICNNSLASERSSIMHSKNNPSNYSYKARYRYCSKCGGDRIHKWFTVRKLSVIDELALQPIPYGKEIKDIKFIIPEDLDIDDENKQAIYDNQELLIRWTFEINVCDDCKEAELWENGIFIKRVCDKR
ncbi:hypothetical protein [Bacillus cereus]|uniref:hypothetical protein n=1 Tax=Bacillus cereus TaxID=1396 RepID=UPI0018F37715|nr:hypothetical protein [Bacillus cereus]